MLCRPATMARFCMDPCIECGCANLCAHVIAGTSVLECELCGALSGDARAVQAFEDRREASTAGVDSGLWPLVRQLQALPSVTVHAHASAEHAADGRPSISLLVMDGSGLAQLDNLAKSLLLAAGELQLQWAIEVVYEAVMLFVLRPVAVSGAGPRSPAVAADVDLLARAIERNQRLSWWRSGLD